MAKRLTKGKSYTVPQAAECLGVTARNVRYHVERMRLGQRMGRMIILSADDVRALASRDTTPGPKPKRRIP